MRTRSILFAGACALAITAPAWAAPGQCFDVNGTPLGPVYDTETPDTRFNTWVQARGGECRALLADEVTLYRGRPADYPPDYGRGTTQSPPVEVRPGAPRSTTVTTWQGDPALAQRLIVTHYRAQQPNITVTDTGQVLQLGSGGYWRIYETVYADGTRRQVAVQVTPNRQYVLMENVDGGQWGDTIYLDE